MRRNLLLDNLIILQDEIERLFERFFGYRPFDREGEEIILFPETDVFETDDQVIIIFEVPGVSLENLQLSASGNSIILEGLKNHDIPDVNENIQYLRAERNFGKFRRIVEVPAPCNMKDANAVLKDGILKVFLNKVKERRQKVYKISIKEE